RAHIRVPDRFRAAASDSGAYPLQFLGFPFLIWAALRLHLVWVCVANMVLSTSALAWTAYGTGPFYQGEVGGSLIYVYVFSLVSWIMTVTLSAVMSGRRDSDVAMASREAAYQAVVQQAAEGIFVLDEQGRVVEANAAAEPMMGCSADAVEGLLFTSLLERGDRKPFAQLLHELEPGSTDLIAWDRAGDDGAPVNLEAAVKRLADGGVHVFIRDVTKARELQRRLDQSQRMEAVGILAGGVAHDFNNLLTVIMGHAGRGLESARRDPEVTRHLEGILRAAERSSDLTNQLLTFTRRSPTRAVVVDVDGVLDDSEDMMRRVLGEGIGYLRARTGNRHGRSVVRMDPVQLEQVLLNLVLNARDAMPQGGQVTVATRVRSRGDADWVVIEVKDSGHGIADDVRPRVFEPFFSTKSELSRTGLGLAVCSRIVEAADGVIEFESELGRGTTFRVVLPLAQGEPEMTGATPAEDERSARAASVLLVEDEAELRALISEALEARGYLVTSVPDGEAAIQLVKPGERRFDVVLTDVVLPGKTGPRVAKTLKRRDPDLVVLFMSGYDLTDLGGRGVSSRDLGEVIRKPFTIPALVKAVAEALERGGQGQEPASSAQHR
ncbi:MAG: response regulator, partial [Gemmatimonadetes bacterium]|nr:response regulator [Gemmatimonadota bacterium]